jgi:hypothetical protein
MDPLPFSNSDFRVAKRRVDAVVTLAGGETAKGAFFLAGGSSRHAGAERVGDLLNSESGFFPFEIHLEERTWTVLYNRAHILTVQVFDDEPRRDPGYAVATERVVSILLSDRRRVTGALRVYRPDGHNRLSDWARQPDVFRYIEADDATLIINAAHIVSVTEVTGS